MVRGGGKEASPSFYRKQKGIALFEQRSPADQRYCGQGVHNGKVRLVN
jgi:hypothetical protein